MFTVEFLQIIPVLVLLPLVVVMALKTQDEYSKNKKGRLYMYNFKKYVRKRR